MAEILVPTARIGVAGIPPDVFQSCLLSSPTTVDPVEPGGDEDPGGQPGAPWYPLPPTVSPSPPATQPTIVDTSPSRMIGCLHEASGMGPQRLSYLFPDAIEGDGVIERSNNHIWVLRSGLWQDVGPNPGPRIVQAVITIPYNETLNLRFTSRSRLGVNSSISVLNLEKELRVTSTSGTVLRQVIVAFTGEAPAVSIIVSGPEPTIDAPATGPVITAPIVVRVNSRRPLVIGDSRQAYPIRAIVRGEEPSIEAG